MAKAFHWIMAAIIVAAWLIGFYTANFLSYADPNSGKGDLITVHKQIATTVLFLVVLRILWRMTHAAPELPDSMSPAIKLAAHLGHLALYALMLAVPLSGWLFSSAAGYPVPVAWLFHLPALTGKVDEADLAAFRDVHTYLAWAIGLLVAGHAAMAVKHEFIDKDGTLSKMTSRRG